MNASEESILEYVLETVQAGYWNRDIRQNTEYLSPQLKEMLGYSEGSDSSPQSWLDVVHSEDRPWVQERYEQHITSGGKTPFRVEIRCCQQDGTVVWMQCQSKVLACDKTGAPLRAIGSCIDITAQKQVEKELRHYQTALTSLKKIATNAHLSYDEQINTALAAVSRYLNLPLGIVSCIEGNECQLINVVTNDDYAGTTKGEVLDVNDTLCRIVYTEDRATGIHHVGNSTYVTHPGYAKTGLETFIGAPVYVRGQKYGTVSFSSLTPREKPFNQYDLEFIEILANWVGYSLEKRNKSNALEISQKKLRAVFENARDAILLVDHDSLKIIDCNRMAIDLYGLDGREELIGRQGIKFHKYLFTGEQNKAYYSLAQAGDFFSAEVEYTTKRNSQFWGNLSVFVFELEGHLFQWVRIVDVSEARYREQELQVVKEVLSQQTRDLQAANEEIRSINDSLEFMVRERTDALEERNRQLADFAFLNAHKMRGPLARILGLVDILRFTQSREQEREYLQHIIQSASELDQVIKTAANTLVTPEYARGESSSASDNIARFSELTDD